jgi:hypothetical protein
VVVKQVEMQHARNTVSQILADACDMFVVGMTNMLWWADMIKRELPFEV